MIGAAKHFILRLVTVVALGIFVSIVKVGAQGGIYVPLLTYRTGPFAASGTPLADGMHDYLTMLNERDAGIGGVKLVVEECETGFDTKRGLECYGQAKAGHPVVINPQSPGLAWQLIPQAAVDHIPILMIGYGLSASADGDTFPWIFNPPATYWDGLSALLKYIALREGGLQQLHAKTIGYIFLDSGYGREPILLLEQLAKDYGFNVKLYPVAAAEMQDQAAVWGNVDRDRPDWMIMWGWGAMNPTAIKEAVKIKYPLDHFIGNWWSGSDEEMRQAGEDGKGYLALNLHGLGADYPAIRDIIEHVVDRDDSQVPSRDKVGENFYNRGVFNAVIAAEAIRIGQGIAGKNEVDADDVRRGLESLEISAQRWVQLGLAEFSAPLANVSCENHSGHHGVYVQQWDGAWWVKVSDWIVPMKDKVRPLLKAAAKDYVSRNQPWPTRTEHCDKRSEIR